MYLKRGILRGIRCTVSIRVVILFLVNRTSLEDNPIPTRFPEVVYFVYYDRQTARQPETSRVGDYYLYTLTP
jgi:hypothetical protein